MHVCVYVLPYGSCPGSKVHLTSGKEQTGQRSDLMPSLLPDHVLLHMFHRLVRREASDQKRVQSGSPTSCRQFSAFTCPVWCVNSNQFRIAFDIFPQHLAAVWFQFNLLQFHHHAKVITTEIRTVIESRGKHCGTGSKGQKENE